MKTRYCITVDLCAVKKSKVRRNCIFKDNLRGGRLLWILVEY
ncbi:hypothetical protein [Tissierella simiarum]|nr:hypothetical protein [Tissierella simiarum]